VSYLHIVFQVSSSTDGVALSKRNNVVKAFPSDEPISPFGISILPESVADVGGRECPLIEVVG